MLMRLANFKKYMLAFLDCSLIMFGYFTVAALFYTDGISDITKHSLVTTVYVACIIYVFVLYILRVYNNILRFSSVREYFICYSGCLIAAILLALLRTNMPNLLLASLNLIAGVFIGVLLVGMRVAIRMYLNYAILENKNKQMKLLIIGAGSAGNMVIKDILFEKEQNFHIVGLIDDDKSKRGCTISGLKVLGSRHMIGDMCRKYEVDMILFAIPTATPEDKKAILEICRTTGCKVRVLPGINDLILTKRITDNFRDLDISDLLFREPVKLDNKNIQQYIENQVVLVTGGGGSIGSELCRQIVKYDPKKLIVLDIYENNAYDIENELKLHFPHVDVQIVIASVRDRARMEQIFDQYRPNAVFHAAAHKHVPLMEYHPCEAVKNNVFGTLNAAQCADKYGCKKFILISTDKAVNPTNVMGATKRICELIVQNINSVSKTEFVAVRFGNVLGSNGSVLPLFKKQIAEGGPITVTHKEITRFFMTIPEAAQLVLQAAAYAQGGEIFVLDMGKPVKIYEMAENLIHLSGLRPHIDIEIKITGLRPGEKLYEELLHAEEGLQKTTNQKIYVAQPIQADYIALMAQFDKLAQALKFHDDEEIKDVISSIVPTYVRNDEQKSCTYNLEPGSEYQAVSAVGSLQGTA